MYLMSLWANQHYASSGLMLIRSIVHIEDPLVGVFLIGCGVLTIFRLSHFHYLDIVRHPGCFGCIVVGELCYKVGKGLPFNFRSGVIAYIKLPQLNRPFEEPT